MWLARLQAVGRDRERAIAELRALLVRAAQFEVRRRRGTLPHLSRGEHDDLAQQAADDALVALLRKLDDFRCESRFTTWAYKFALLEAGARIRRRAWQGREVPTDAEDWNVIARPGSAPVAAAETKELIAAIRDAIEQTLTPHQREVLVALTLNDVPIDVLAERLNTSRGALYKTLHDARRSLRRRLAAQGLDVGSAHGAGDS
jgi:RNA polymerase sigma-70 factor (ECF subfamily)